MDRTSRTNARPRASTLIVAMLAGLLGFLLVFPASGVDSDPPVCRSMFFYVVPCDAWVAWAVGVGVAVSVGCVLWMIDRRR